MQGRGGRDGMAACGVSRRRDDDGTAHRDDDGEEETERKRNRSAC